MEPSEKRERFREYAACALGLLYDAHPDHVTLRPSTIVRDLGQDLSKPNVFLCERSLSWLDENGYIRSFAGNLTEPAEFAERIFRDSRLSTQGFAALNEQIEFRGTMTRIGDALVEQLQTSGGAGRDAFIGSLIGSAFAAFAKLISS
jgi:hypothetical protein